jgi:hypothetical protein
MTLDWKQLLDPQGPLFSIVPGEEDELDDLVRTAPQDPALVVRLLRGKRCTTPERLFQECAAALQFPAYFGENWDAFEECLSDLEWLPSGGLVLFITQSDRLLEESTDDLRTLGDILRSAAADWKESHPRAPYRIVLHVQPDGEAEAWERLSASGLLSEDEL